MNFQWLNESNLTKEGKKITIYAPAGTDFFCNDGTVWSRKADAGQKATQVFAELTTEKLLEQRPDCLYFCDVPGQSYSCKILLTFDTAVTDFTFSQVEGTVDEEGNFLCTGSQVLYRQPEIGENQLLMLETDLGEILPTMPAAIFRSIMSLSAARMEHRC